LVQESHIDDITLPYSQYVKAHHNKAKFVQGTLEKVNANSVEIATPNKKTETINFDYLILCTGGTY